MNFIHSVLLVGSVVLLATGCATSPTIHLPTSTTNAEPQRLEVDGLAISLHPMTDKAEVKHTFKENLLAEGVLPIKLTVENRNATASFLIAREKILVMNETTGATNSSRPGEVVRDLTTVSRGEQLLEAAGTTSTLFFLMTVMNPPDGVVINRDREYKLASKEFYTRTLGPGQKAEGFLFFRFLKPADSSGAYHVILQVKNSSTDEVKPFSFKMNLN